VVGGGDGDEEDRDDGGVCWWLWRKKKMESILMMMDELARVKEEIVELARLAAGGADVGGGVGVKEKKKK